MDTNFVDFEFFTFLNYPILTCRYDIGLGAIIFLISNSKYNDGFTGRGIQGVWTPPPRH